MVEAIFCWEAFGVADDILAVWDAVEQAALELDAMFGFFWAFGSLVAVWMTVGYHVGLLPGESHCLSTHVSEDDSS